MTQARRLRLALVVPNLVGGGGVQSVARFIKDVVRRSDRYDLVVVSLPESARDQASLRVLSPSSWPHGPEVTHGEWEGEPFVHVGAVAVELEFQRYRPRTALTVVLAGCDLIQVVGGFPAWANAVVGLGTPVAVHAATLARLERRQRDAHPRGAAERWRQAMTGFTSRMDDRALQSVDAIQVMNPWMLEYATTVNTGRAVDLRYLPPGVNARVFRPQDTREQDEQDYVLCVGRFDDPRKKLGVLLDAFARIPAATRDRVRLILAGTVPPPRSFWERADALGLRARISIVDRPDSASLVRLYQGARVFALPSDEEGFGMVLLEAMACGVPVVSTRSGGPEGIVTDGEDGFLVQRDDAAAMASRLAALLEQPALAVEMGHKARQTIERRYDERVAGDAFIDLWERMARKAGAAS